MLRFPAESKHTEVGSPRVPSHGLCPERTERPEHTAVRLMRLSVCAIVAY